MSEAHSIFVALGVST